jgi:replication factor A1
MRTKIYPSEYLAFLASKYDVEINEFFNALIQAAGKNEKQSCGSLTIELRGKIKNKLSILIMQENKVVAQFQLDEEFLLNEQADPVRAAARRFYLQEKNTSSRKANSNLPQVVQIKDLRIGMKKVALKAKIIEVAKPTCVVTRFGNCANIANAMVSDETGKIKLCLWNEQIKIVKVGDTIQISNAHISEYKHERQMRIGKNGTLVVQ